MNKITKIYVCWKLYENGMSPEKIPPQINVHRATLYRWIKGILASAPFVERLVLML